MPAGFTAEQNEVWEDTGPHFAAPPSGTQTPEQAFNAAVWFFAQTCTFDGVDPPADDAIRAACAAEAAAGPAGATRRPIVTGDRVAVRTINGWDDGRWWAASGPEVHDGRSVVWVVREVRWHECVAAGREPRRDGQEAHSWPGQHVAALPVSAGASSASP